MPLVPPLAHETWFTDEQPLDWSFAVEPATLAVLASAVAITIGVRLGARSWNGTDVPFLARLAPWMPFAIRLHLAVSLIGLLSLGYYLSPAMDLQADVPGILLGAVMAVVAVGMATGWHVREAAWLLIAAGPLGMLEFGPGEVVQRIDLLGLAVYLLVAGPGRWSADLERGAVAEPSVPDVTRALWALRVTAGTALIVVAFREKLASPEMALTFLQEYPQFNVAQQAGIGLSDLEFTRLAGGIEVLFGLLLISGAMPQLVVVAAGIPFNATLWFFGTSELVGHLPTYGTMLVLLVYGSDPRLREAARDLWPFAGQAGRVSPRRTT